MFDTAVERYLAENGQRHLEELKEFLRIPSVSALPQHWDDVRRAADWVAGQLRSLGFPTVEVMETGGHPVVFAHWPAEGGSGPTALVYGHYDVQPPDPLDLWQTPPFEPEVRGERLYARGAADDKGNLFMPIKALEALIRLHGRPPIGIKCLFDGEEEIGSTSLPRFVREHRDLLRADLVICADGPQWGPDQPSLCVASKGICACQVDLRTASTDAHSGNHGAAIPNAVERMARLAASFHTPEGRVAVKGFYDRVRDLTPAEREAIARIPFDEAAYAAEMELPALWGEPGWTALERRWARPTLDLNGIWGGFQGEGVKTVTPCEAHLKITCRLVPDQEPVQILDLIEAHVREHTPLGAQASVRRFPGSARPYSIRPDHPAVRLAGDVLRALYGKEPYVIRLGGTLPVAETFQTDLGTDLVFFSFGMPGDQVHAPNESFRLDSFDRARRAHAAYLQQLASLR